MIRNLIKISFIYIFFFSKTFVFSQKDTIYTIPNTIIESSKDLNHQGSSSIYLIDSALKQLHLSGTLGDLLTSDNTIFVKSYGTGSATFSLRGASASQTSVLWNGIPLNNSMLGLTDLSIIPANFMNEIKIQAGGGSALWGNGAMGGVVHLNNTNDFSIKRKLTFSVNYSSIFNLNTVLLTHFSIKKLYFSINLFKSLNQNKINFNYSNEIKTLKHAYSNQNGILFDVNYLYKNHKFEYNLWLQEAKREIPPLLGQEISVANQYDFLFRNNLNYKINLNKISFQIKSAFFREILNFKDSSIHLISNSLATTFFQELESKLTLNKHLLNFGLNINLQNANIKEYEGSKKQDKFSLFCLHKFKLNENIEIYEQIRQEIVNLKFMPLAFGVSSNFKFNSKFKVNLGINRSYRFPSLNDLFWNPGGNELLKAEKSISYEGSFQFNTLISSNIKWNLDINSYFRNAKDWIQWKPNGAFWSPFNLAQVHTYGSEFHSNLNFKFKKIIMGIKNNLGYSQAQKIKSNISNDNSLYKQLIYTPLFQLQNQVFIKYKLFTLNVNYCFTSKRFTSSDNLEYLPNNNLISIYFDSELKLKNHSIHLNFLIENLLNVNYQNIAQRPMPLRTFRVGITYNFLQKNSIIQ